MKKTLAAISFFVVIFLTVGHESKKPTPNDFPSTERKTGVTEQKSRLQKEQERAQFEITYNLATLYGKHQINKILGLRTIRKKSVAHKAL